MVPKDGGPAHGPAGQLPAVSASGFRAFISYSHRDTKIAEWLHRAIETYRVPKPLIGRVTMTGTIGPRPGKVFRDRDELEVAADLSGKINEALEQSQFLVVLCSPASARSKWVNQEVINFKRLKGAEHIIAVIVDGEPGHESQECFVPALRFKVSPDGELTDEAAEPIAADLRPGKDPKRRVQLKVIAGLLGVGLDELIRRDAARRQRFTAYAMAASLLGMTVMAGLAWSAMVSRDDAERRGRKAEEMMEFLLTRMQVPLREVGRLKEFNEAVDRTVGYYASENISDLADESLGRYSRALLLEAETRQQEGRLDDAIKSAERAAEMTAAVMARNPDDPARISDHGQSEFWIGNLHLERRDMKQAIEHMSAYAELSEKASAAQPDNLPWQANAARARASLGVALRQVGDLARATEAFAASTAAWARIRAQRPNDAQAKFSAANTMNSASDVLRDQGHMPEALKMQQEALSIVQALYVEYKNNRDAKFHVVRLQRRFARLAYEAGDTANALAQLQEARRLGTELLTKDPDNAGWQDLVAQTATDLAAVALLTGDVKLASQELASAELTSILAKPSKPGAFTPRLQAQLTARAVAARIDEGRGNKKRALALAQTNVQDLAAIDKTSSLDAAIAVAEAEVMLGDLADNPADARNHWRGVTTLNAQALGIRADYLIMQAQCRSGDRSAAATLSARLKSAGYISPPSAALVDKCSQMNL
jgi:tetratricopeptide (TPR) repeat protein